MFLLSVGVGVPVCLLYIGAHSLFRALFGKDRAVFCADIVFSVLATLISFFFMVFYNNGRVRLHLVVGEAVGFFVFMRAAGKHLAFLCFGAADVLRSCAGRLLYPFVRVGRAFVNIFRQMKKKTVLVLKKKRTQDESCQEESKKVEINSKKYNFIGKILLKIRNKSV